MAFSCRILRLASGMCFDRRESILQLMKDQRIPLFIHARALNALAKCPFHPAGLIAHSRGRSNGHIANPALSRAPTVISHARYFSSQRFARGIAFRSRARPLQDRDQKGPDYTGCMWRHDFSHERMRLPAQRAL